MYVDISKAVSTSADIYKDDSNPDYNRFSCAAKITDHINTALANFNLKVAAIKELEKGLTYPYNDYDPYSYDIYAVTLNDGTAFKVKRRYGRPLWTGNVLFCNSLDTETMRYCASH